MFHVKIRIPKTICFLKCIFVIARGGRLCRKEAIEYICGYST